MPSLAKHERPNYNPITDELECLNCKKVLVDKQISYCGTACFEAMNPIWEFDCHLCGKVTEQRGNTPRKYCSNACLDKVKQDPSLVAGKPHIQRPNEPKFDEAHIEACRQRRLEREQVKFNSATHEERAAADVFCRNAPKGYQADHWIPLSKGGKHHIDNLVYLPAKENNLKLALMPDEWLLKRAALVKSGRLHEDPQYNVEGAEPPPVIEATVPVITVDNTDKPTIEDIVNNITGTLKSYAQSETDRADELQGKLDAIAKLIQRNLNNA
ncbi:MAG: HNH endonuclease [Gammaproteobacteria bacterium]|nr:HNH endonuclease [Gammaproteobacteria bacterium]